VAGLSAGFDSPACLFAMKRDNKKFEDSKVQNLEEFEKEVEEPEHIPVENRCVECGQEMVSACSCCGAPLCVRHTETQAGFCSNFGKKELEEDSYLEVTSRPLGLKNDVIRITEYIEVSGCIVESNKPGKLDRFFPMEDLPEGADRPVSDLDEDSFEVVG